MEKQNPIFSLKNFRSFGEEGADFELAPITVLTGCNSAGKSSLVKALMLMSMQNNRKGVLPMSNLQISSKELNLGRFDKVLHKNTGTDTICLSYKMWSNYLLEDVVVNRLFRGSKNDMLNNGELKAFTIEKEDGIFIYKYRPNAIDYIYPEFEENDDAIRSNFLRFSKACSYVDIKRTLSILDLKDQRDEEMRMVKEWCESELKNLSNEINQSHIEKYPFAYLQDFVNKRSPLEMTGFEKALNESLSKEKIEEQKFKDYFHHVVDEIVAPWFTHEILYIDSSSAQIDRIYDVDNGNKFCKALRSLNAKLTSYHNGDYPQDSHAKYHKPLSFVNKWVKEFQIGDGIEVEGTTEGLGILVFLIKDGEKTLLADEGYGITQLVSLLMQIDNTIPVYFEGIPTFDIEKFKTDYNNMDMTYPRRVICVEEPEVHLHPKYQSLLAEMFVEAYQKYNIHFIIETHSEYLIRKLQVMVADKENSLAPNDVSLNYVEKGENGVSTNRKINILDDGRLDGSFGEGFYDEATGLSMELLRMKIEAK